MVFCPWVVIYIGPAAQDHQRYNCFDVGVGYVSILADRPGLIDPGFLGERFHRYTIK